MMRMTTIAVLFAAALLAQCGGGSGGSEWVAGTTPPPAPGEGVVGVAPAPAPQPGVLPPAQSPDVAQPAPSPSPTPSPAPAPAPAPAAIDRHYAPEPIAANVDVPNPQRGQYNWLGVPSQVPGSTMTDLYWRDELQWGEELEPRIGVYDFTRFEQGLAAAKAMGGRLSFRIMAYCPGCGGNLTPSWVPRQGNGVPDWNAEGFLSAWEKLFEALGARYADDPRVGYIDFGGYGAWGEWGEWDGGMTIARDNARRMMRAVIQAFPKQYKLINAMGDFPNIAVRLADRIGMRIDCIGGDENYNFESSDDPLIRELWKHAPLTGEWCPKPETTAARGLRQIDEAHLSMLSSGNFPLTWARMSAAERDAYVQAYARSGYRYVLESLNLKGVAMAGQTLTVTSVWSNRGVARSFDTWAVKLRLLDAQGKLAWEAPLGVDLASLPGMGSTATNGAAVTLPSGLHGRFTVAVAAIDPSGYNRPLRIANQGQDEAGNLVLGSLDIAKP